MKESFVFKRGYWYGPPIAPGDVVDYKIDWTELLDGDVIDTVTWALTNASKTNQAKTTNTTTVWLTPSNVSEIVVTCKVTTVAGRTLNRSFKLEVKP